MQIIDESDITSSALVTTLINAGETRTREYKRVSGKMVGKALETVCGFANADVVRIAGVDTLKASKLLTTWREQGLLEPLPGRGKRNMAYVRAIGGGEEVDLLSTLGENKQVQR